MSVFPAASSNHVPQPWAILMSDPVNNFYTNSGYQYKYKLFIIELFNS